MIQVADIGSLLQFRADPVKPDRHAFIEPAKPMPLDSYQAALCGTAPRWMRYA